MIKLIAIDFDGTFLDDSHFKYDLSYVDKIRKANISQEIIFASGRATAGIVTLVEKLGVGDIVRYIIGHNGAEIFDLKEHKVVYQSKLSDDEVMDILKTLDDNGYENPVCLHDWDKIYALRYKEIVDLENKVNFTRTVKINDSSEFSKENRLKMMIFTDINDQEIIYQTLKDKYKDELSIKKSGEILIEITGKGVNKASALAHLSEMLGVKMEEIVAFGNEDNDLEMLEEVGYGYAMKNATPQLLERIKRVTKYTNNECGVEREIIDILGI